MKEGVEAMTTAAAYAADLPTFKDAAAQTAVVPPAFAGASATRGTPTAAKYERCPPGASEEPPNQTTRPAGSAHRNFRLDRFFSKQP